MCCFFLLLKFQQNLRNTREKVHFSFIMNTKLAAITSKFGRSIMYDLVSCLIIHFGGTKQGFKTNSRCEKIQEVQVVKSKISHFFPQCNYFLEHQKTSNFQNQRHFDLNFIMCFINFTNAEIKGPKTLFQNTIQKNSIYQGIKRSRVTNKRRWQHKNSKQR